MQKISVCLLWILALALAHGQEGNLPTDFRQHNLTYLGTKLFNAAMLPHWESPNSLLLCTRWQCQLIYGEPSALFVNYTQQFDSLSSFRAGFLQHNTGVFVNTGGQLNYSRAFQLADGIRL